MPDRPLPRLAGNRLFTKRLDQDPLGEILRARRNDGSAPGAFELVRRFSGAGIDTTALAAAAKSSTMVISSLKGPGIAKGAAIFEAEGFVHLGNEYSPGHSLGRLLEKTVEEGFPVAVDQSLLIVDKIISALDTAYQFRVDDTRVQHRFVVPAFVWVTEEGEVRLTGFGVGDALSKMSAQGKLAEAYGRYLAPESRGGAKAGKNGDVYSASAILLELLTGEKAPADPSPAFLDDATIAAEGSNLPDDLRALLGKGLAKDPAARFETITDLKKELSKILFGGAYAPTTFNLAFFMNNLFRGEMEQEAKERAQEETLDPAAFAPKKEASKPVPAPAAPPAPPPPAAPSFSSAAPEPSGGGKGMLFAIVGVVVVGGAIAAYFLTRKPEPSAGGASTAQPAATPAPAPPAPSLTAQATNLDPKAFEEEVRKRVAEEMTRIEAQMKSEQDAAKKKEQEKQLAALKAQQAEVIQKQEAAKKAEATSDTSTKKVDDDAAAKKAKEATEAARKLEETLRATEKAAAQMAATPSAPASAAPAPPPPTPVPTPPPAGGEKAVKEGDLVDQGQVDTPPVIVDRVRPNYPRVALMRKSQGIVILSMLVNEKGKVIDVKVLRGAQDTLLNDAAIDAARDYKFEPATAGGKKVKTWFSETITFKP